MGPVRRGLFFVSVILHPPAGGAIAALLQNLLLLGIGE